MIKYVLSAKDSDNIIFLRASGSVVEYRLAKARVAGSNPVSRSYFLAEKSYFFHDFSFFCAVLRAKFFWERTQHV